MNEGILIRWIKQLKCLEAVIGLFPIAPLYVTFEFLKKWLNRKQSRSTYLFVSKSSRLSMLGLSWRRASSSSSPASLSWRPEAMCWRTTMRHIDALLLESGWNKKISQIQQRHVFLGCATLYRKSRFVACRNVWCTMTAELCLKGWAACIYICMYVDICGYMWIYVEVCVSHVVIWLIEGLVTWNTWLRFHTIVPGVPLGPKT